MRILYIEDEKYLADAVIHVLNKAGIATEWAADGITGLDLAVQPIYDAIVLDIMLPKLSGLDLLRTIREKGVKTPVIMLSALSEVDDKIKGLNYGADDYLAKPFKTSELIARLTALTRRPPLTASQVIRFEDLVFNLDNRTLNDIPLTEKEAAIMQILIQNPNQIQKKEFILARVWGSNNAHADNYAEVYISYLRKKLKSLHSKVTIKTLRSLGYKLCSKN